MKKINFKNISNKRWSAIFIFIAIFINLAVISFNYIIDPYQFYRKATLYTFTIQDQRYLNAGLAKNYTYDSAIIGSSMTENFYANDVNNILHFKKTIKLPFQGASIFEETALLHTILNTKKASNIIFGLDIYSFSGEAIPLSKSSFFPQYLYDKNILNDLSYVLNFKVLEKSIKALKKPYDKNKVKQQLNSIYNWQKIWQTSFNIKNVLKLYNQEKKQFTNKTQQEKNKLLKHFHFSVLQRNFDNELLPIIKANPHTDFYIFYPPYSILAYKLMYQQNILKDTIKFKQYIFNTLKHYKNVKIYDFQVADEIVKNLHNYKDVNHYTEDINKWMLEQMAKDNYLVTEKNIKHYSEQLIEYVKI